MKRLATLLFPLLLAACAGPVDLYYKPGGSVSRLATDTTDCQVRALRDAPVATQVRQRPPVYFPGNRWCNAAGQCYVSPGYWMDGGVYSVDVNAGLRDRVEAQCMARRGYRPVSLPRCSPQVAQAAGARLTTTLPSLSSGSCIIPYEGGGFQIVTAG